MLELKKYIFATLILALLWAMFWYVFPDETAGKKAPLDIYVEQVAIENAIGQILMVGLTADINTASGSNSLNEELGEIGIGAAIVSSKNYYDDGSLSDGDYLQKIITFNNSVQDKTLHSKLKLPLIIAADFEGYGYGPVNRALVPPPSALSLGAVRDGDAIEKIGGYTGLELESIGIHAMLGPVLDAYNLSQGEETILQNRSFAGTSEGVAKIASHYVKGLKRANIILIAKHFPSHGSVEANPHSLSIPTYQASTEQMTSDLMPFLYLNKHIDGIMTSHVKVDQIDNQIATFSKTLINEFLPSNEFGNSLIITDDLSEMGSIRKYMTDNKKSYGDIAIEAFDAGHDMLLFAHCNESQKGTSSGQRKGRFTLDELKEVKEKLTLHISGVKSREVQFRNSLKKILKLKLSIAQRKNKKWSFERLASEHVKEAAFLTDISGRSVMSEVGRKFIESFELTALDGANEDVGKNLVRNALNKAVTTVHNKNNVRMLSERESSERIIFAVYGEGYELFKNNFRPKFNNAIFLKIPRYKEGEEFRFLEKEIKSQIGKADLLVYTARDRSDSDLLNRIRVSHSKFNTKTIVLCLNSTGVLDNALLNETTTYVLYTNHPIAFEVGGDVLAGLITPKGVTHAPTSIGENGDFYNVTNTQWIEPASIGSVPDLNTIESERASRLRLEQKFVLIEKSWEMPSRWFVFTSTLIFALYFLHLVGKNPKVENPFLKVLADRKMFIVLAVLIFLMSIYFYIYGSGKLHELVTEGKVLSKEYKEILK